MKHWIVHCKRLLLAIIFSAKFACAADIDIYAEQASCSKNNVIASIAYFSVGESEVNVMGRDNLFDTYISMFRFSSDGVGMGNVKKYTSHRDADGRVWLLDVINKSLYDHGLAYVSVLDEDMVKIHNHALSFWTLPAFLPSLAEADNKFPEYVLGRDGSEVQMGGVGQRIPGFSDLFISFQNTKGARQLFTDHSESNTLLPLEWESEYLSVSISTWRNLSVWQAILPHFSYDNTLAEKAMIHDARGVDVFHSQYKDSVNSGAAKEWLLGDVMHSRPFVINYPEKIYGANQQRIVFGSNDGFLHWIKNDSMAGEQSGVEQFAFIPGEILLDWPSRFVQSYQLEGDYGVKHLYGMDGEISSVANLSANGHFTYLYAGMRRGGKSYYAFDVTNPDSPPALLGKISKQQSQFSELAYSFAKAVPALVNYAGTVEPVLLIAGGYSSRKDDYISAGNSSSDAGYFNNTHGTTADDEGNVVYIVHAKSLELLWKVTANALLPVDNTHYYHPDFKNAVPSTVSVLDVNGDGLMDRIYVGDIGGHVWRGDFPSCVTTDACTDVNFRQKNWRITQLASLGTSLPEGDTRFFYPPAVFYSMDDNGGYVGVVIASGDIENPLELTDKNKLFFIKDRSPEGDKVITHLHLPDITDCVQSITIECVRNGVSNTSTHFSYGWAFDLSSAGVGVKASDKPFVQNGMVYLTAYRPRERHQSACQQLQQGAVLFMVDLRDGTAANDNKTRFIDIGLNQLSSLTMLNNQLHFPKPVPLGFLTELADSTSVISQTSSHAPENHAWQREFWLEGTDN